ncbi:metal-sulfur cluster assembly factor [Dactylosporangium sp. CA-092794]|uniref:metal-sulfur cluster assembly factor n=1 Tax=Dactylosporangium sp. CA-092794 TaxID=3239929 RepID=UPI003D8F579E
MTTATGAALREGRIQDALREVLDPDLGVNVIDLGFVYAVELDDRGSATLRMTLTSPACPLTKIIEDQIQTALVAGGLATAVRVDWVFSPVWTPDRITEEGREQLRAIGFSM